MQNTNNIQITRNQVIITLQGAPMTANRLLGQNWYKRKQNADVWKDQIRYLYNQNKDRLEPLNLPFTHVHITALIGRSRFMDYDGAVSVLKPVIDGLKKLFIVDDSWELTGAWEVGQVKTKRKEEFVRIELKI